MPRHPNLLKRSRSALLIVDVQERFAPVINDMDAIVENIVKLIRGCKILDIPVFYTEQYPKGLGRTVKEVLQYLSDVEPVEKLRFSTCCENAIMKPLKTKAVQQIILVGIETHVCMLQSALDFTEAGFQVHVVKDATGSRKNADRDTALQRLIQQGITVTTTESALFELTEFAGTDEFKQISGLVK